VVHGQGPVRRHLPRALYQGHGGVMFNRPPTHGNTDSPARAFAREEPDREFTHRCPKTGEENAAVQVPGPGSAVRRHPQRDLQHFQYPAPPDHERQCVSSDLPRWRSGTPRPPHRHESSGSRFSAFRTSFPDNTAGRVVADSRTEVVDSAMSAAAIRVRSHELPVCRQAARAPSPSHRDRPRYRRFRIPTLVHARPSAR
jgi:hypothetical protein